MADFTPNEGEEEMLKVLLGKISAPNLYVGLFQNTIVEFEGYGDDITWSDITPTTNFAEGAEQTLAAGTWTVPGSPDQGDPAIFPELTFTGGVGGADSVVGYYIRSSNNVLWVVGLNPDVELSSTPLAMPAGAELKISPQLGLE